MHAEVYWVSDLDSIDVFLTKEDFKSLVQAIGSNRVKAVLRIGVV